MERYRFLDLKNNVEVTIEIHDHTLYITMFGQTHTYPAFIKNDVIHAMKHDYNMIQVEKPIVTAC